MAEADDIENTFKQGENSISAFYNSVRCAWTIRCFSYRFANIPMKFSAKLYLSELLVMNESLALELKKYTNQTFSTKELNTKQIDEIIQFFYSVTRKYPVFYRSLYYSFKHVLEQIGFEYILNRFGVKSLPLFPFATADDMKSVFVNVSNQTQILVMPENPEITHLLQSIYIRKFNFPTKYPDMPFAWTLSLTNTSVHSNVNFVDIIFQEAIEALTVDEFQRISDAMGFIPTLYPIFIIMSISTIYSNPEKYEILFQEQISPSYFGAEYYERLKADIALIKLMSFLTGTSFTKSSFNSHSFPYFVRFMLNQPEIVKLTSMRFLIIDDKDAENDFDFIHSYLCIREMLLFYHHPGPDRNEILQLNDSILDHLQQIKNKDNAEKTANEIFSLIFLQKDGKFICNAPTAQILLKSISQYTSLPYVKQAFVSMMPSLSGQHGWSLSAYFRAGEFALMQALSSHNWPIATKIINASPLYKEIYDTALAVWAFTHTEPLPSGCEPRPIITLEVPLVTSLPDTEGLLLARNEYPQFAKLINRRIQNIGEEATPIPGKRQWDQVNALACSLDTDEVAFLRERKGEAFMDVLNRSKILSQYINYLSAFARCLFASGARRSLPLNLRLAVMNAVNARRIDDAIALAKLIGIDLFEFCMEHINDYNISREFIDVFIDKHPLVCTTLAVTYLEPDQFPRIPDILKRAPPKLDNTMNEFIGLLQSACDLSLLDDYLFRIDARRVCAIVFDNFDSLPADRILYCLDICGHSTAAFKDPRVQKLCLDRRIRYVTDSKDDKDIVTELAKADELDTLIKFIERKPSRELIQLAIDNLENGKVELLNHFPDFSRYFVSEAPFIVGRFVAEDREKFEAFSRLSQSIRDRSDFFNRESVKSAIMESMYDLEHLTKDHMNFLTHEELFEVLDKPTDMKTLISVSRRCFDLTPLPGRRAMRTRIEEKITQQIYQLSIETPEQENEVLKLMYRVRRLAQDIQIKDAFINTFMNIIETTPCLKYDCKYDFKEGSYSLMRTLYRCDMDSMMLTIAPQLKLDGYQYIISRAIMLANFGMFEEAYSMLDGYRQSHRSIDLLDYDPSVFSNQKKVHEADMTFITSPIMTPFILSSFVNPEMIKLVLINSPMNLPTRGNLAQLAIYPNIEAISTNTTRRSIFDKRRLRTDYADWCDKFLKTFTAIPRSIALLTAFGNFHDSLAQCLISSFDTVVKYGIGTTMATGHFRSFLMRLREMDPEENVTGKFWDGLLAFTDRYNARMYRFEVLLSRGDREQAAQEALQEFKAADRITIQLCLIANAVNCLIEARMMPSRIPHSSNFERTDVIAKCQQELCTLSITNGLPRCPSLVDPVEAIDACAYLLLWKKAELFSRVASMLQIGLKPIVERILVICGEDIDAVAAGIKVVYADMGISVLISLLSQTKFYPQVPRLIIQNISNRETKLKLLIEHDCITAAVADIEADGAFLDLVPLMAHRCSVLGDAMLVQKCVKIFTYYSSRRRK